MSKVQTFFALCKCYCAINVLLTPKAFKNGGYLFTPICLFIAAGLQGFAAVKLTQCGMYVKKISYPDIVETVLGRSGKKFIEVCLALIHF
jgi:amino acid permease